jgi:hypothetical protein
MVSSALIFVGGSRSVQCALAKLGPLGTPQKTKCGHHNTEHHEGDEKSHRPFAHQTDENFDDP